MHELMRHAKLGYYVCAALCMTLHTWHTLGFDHINAPAHTFSRSSAQVISDLWHEQKGTT